MFRNRTAAFALALGAPLSLAAAFAARQDPKADEPEVGYTDTPMLPGGRWHVHDGSRPTPPVVDPGTPSTRDAPGRPPSDAVVLFDGTDASGWRSSDGGPARWDVKDGALVSGANGSIVSEAEFGDCQLHLEFAAPDPPEGRDQGRGNSGVMFFGRYEIQVLDSYDNRTYADGQAAAIYGQVPPLVNASRPPGQWQTYDIIFKRPRFAADGSVESPAYVTMFHNGVLVHDHDALLGPMAFRALPKYEPHGPRGPILLQDHSNPVRFRNIWARDLEVPAVSDLEPPSEIKGPADASQRASETSQSPARRR